MSDLPRCPNHAEGRCPRSDLRLAGESDRHWAFLCLTCGLEWLVSKPRTQREARWRNEVERMEKATAEQRAKAARPTYVTAPRGGWTS